MYSWAPVENAFMHNWDVASTYIITEYVVNQINYFPAYVIYVLIWETIFKNVKNLSMCSDTGQLDAVWHMPIWAGLL